MSDITRIEQYLGAIASGTIEGIPEYPITRIEQYLDYIARNGGGGKDPLNYLGVTTTALSDGDSTNPITINGESVTAKKSDWVIYDSKDFIFNGSVWQEVGDFENYYTKSETDILLSAKANTADVYLKSDFVVDREVTQQEITDSINNIWN